MQRPRDLSELLDRHRVLVCAGAGGVGKTTVSASLALAAARRGKNVLCLTIDPARRLASSFGLDEFPREEMTIPARFFEEHDIDVPGQLTVMMLDPRATFDDLILRFAPSKRDAEHILSRPIYAHLADNLAGTQAYMAMEKVLKVLNDHRYDLILLDTPPSARALDFFDAPRKMSEILDSPATRALIHTLRGGRKFQLHLLGVGLRAALRGMQTITGGSLLVEVADLLASMNELLGGFEERAGQVAEQLKSQAFGYVLVTTPHGRTISDAIELARSMRARGLAIRATVFNRVAEEMHFDWAQREMVQIAKDQLNEMGFEDPMIAKMVALGVAERSRRAEQEKVVEPFLAHLDEGVPRVFLPAFGHDVYRPDRIVEIADQLVGG